MTDAQWAILWSSIVSIIASIATIIVAVVQSHNKRDETYYKYHKSITWEEIEERANQKRFDVLLSDLHYYNWYSRHLIRKKYKQLNKTN